MNCTRGECKGHAEAGGEPGNVLEQPMFFAKFGCPVGGFNKAVQEDVQGVVPKAVEVHVIVVFAGVWMATNQFTNPLAKRFHLFRG